MAPQRVDQPAPKPIVLIGDGGAGIGLQHLVHAAQLDVDVTVLVHNNLVYGMTGGQHSVLTPPGMKTTTTPEGCLVRPIDLPAVLAGAGAGYLARTLAPGEDLTEHIGKAIEHPGFACVEILELCPAFATKRGGMTGKGLKELPELLGLDLGVIKCDTQRVGWQALTSTGTTEREPEGLSPELAWRRLERTARLVVAGRAGERVQSAALFAARAAAAAGLQVAVRTDNPVTQGKGFSLAQLTLAPTPITFTGLVEPDLVVITAEEGYGELAARGLLDPPGQARRYVVDEDLRSPEGLVVERRGLRKRFGPSRAALGALVEAIDQAGWWQRDAWEAAAAGLPEHQRNGFQSVVSRIGW